MMAPAPFILVAPATRGLSLALARNYLQNSQLPVFATYRSSSKDDVKDAILSGIPRSRNVDPARLHVLPLDLASEPSIENAANILSDLFPNDKQPYLHTAIFSGGVLHPEKSPPDLSFAKMKETFQLNVISHLLLIKHFSRFLPQAHQRSQQGSASSPSNGLEHLDDAQLSRWVHVSARVGSISDNHLGGWYSYRASKAALNQIVRTFDHHLQAKHIPAICVGVHPGTVKTELSKPFWDSVDRQGKLFEPEYAAERVVEVVRRLETGQRGKIWDWAGKEVLP